MYTTSNAQTVAFQSVSLSGNVIFSPKKPLFGAATVCGRFGAGADHAIHPFGNHHGRHANPLPERHQFLYRRLND